LKQHELRLRFTIPEETGEDLQDRFRVFGTVERHQDAIEEGHGNRRKADARGGAPLAERGNGPPKRGACRRAQRSPPITAGSVEARP
jgi:hypothetical protein